MSKYLLDIEKADLRKIKMAAQLKGITMKDVFVGCAMDYARSVFNDAGLKEEAIDRIGKKVEDQEVAK